MGQARRYYALQGGWVGQKRPILALLNYAMAPNEIRIITLVKEIGI